MKKRGPRLTEQEKKKIIELLKEKKSAAEVSRIVKRSAPHIWLIAEKNGINLLRRKTSKEETQKIIELLKEKNNVTEVARIVKRSRSTVARIAKTSGIKLAIYQ